jgi:uncharacterized membrane protein YjjB (DUF3815 family)
MNPVWPAPGYAVAFVLATVYGAGFHLVFGGPLRKLVFYLFASWLGFAVGHWCGVILGIRLLAIGPVHTFSASLGSWLALFLSRWLSQAHPAAPGSKDQQL